MFLGIYAMILHHFSSFLFPLSLFMDRYLSCIFGTQGQMYPDSIYLLRFFCIIYFYEINKSPASFFRYIRTYSFIAHYTVR